MRREQLTLAALRGDIDELGVIIENLTVAIEHLIEAVAGLSQQVRLLGLDRFDVEEKKSPGIQ